MRTVLTGAALVACLAAVRCGGNTSSGPTPPTNTRRAIRTRATEHPAARDVRGIRRRRRHRDV
jgi:hypothetical protein